LYHTPTETSPTETSPTETIEHVKVIVG